MERHTYFLKPAGSFFELKNKKSTYRFSSISRSVVESHPLVGRRRGLRSLSPPPFSWHVYNMRTEAHSGWRGVQLTACLSYLSHFIFSKMGNLARMQPASKSVAVFANSSLDAKHSPTVQTNTRATPRQTLQIQLKTPSPLPVTVDRHHHHQGSFLSLSLSLPPSLPPSLFPSPSPSPSLYPSPSYGPVRE